MRTLQLATIAAEAELLRLRRVARRTTFRVAYAAIALLFLGATLATALVATVLFLAARVGLTQALWIVAAVNLAIGIGLILMAAYSKPDAVEVEAQAVRDTAFRGMRRATTGTAIAGELTRKLFPFVSMWLFNRRK